VSAIKIWLINEKMKRDREPPLVMKRAVFADNEAV